MTESRPRQSMDRLLTILQRQLEAGEAGEWDSVEALESEKQELLGQKPWEPLADRDTETARELLQEMLDIAESLSRLAVSARDDIGAQLKDLKTGNKALDAYEANR